MATMNVITTVTVNGKTYKIKEMNTFFSALKKSYIQGTTEQLRFLAYALKDYLIDKLLAQLPNIGKSIVFRPNSLNKILLEPQEEKNQDVNLALPIKRVIIPKDTKYEFKSGNIPFSFKPLKQNYLEKKIKSNLDPRILIATGEYLQNIVVRKKIRTNKKDIFYAVTVSRRKTKRGNITFSTLAKIHEFGTEKYTLEVLTREGKKENIIIQVPARPHWQPTYEVAKKALENLGNVLSTKELQKNLEELQKI